MDDVHQPVEGEAPFDDNVQNIYDVKIAVAVGLTFDKQPTERELRQAMIENVIERLNSYYTYDVDLEDDVEYTFLESEGE